MRKQQTWSMKLQDYKEVDLELLNKRIQQGDRQYIVKNTENIDNSRLNFTEKFMSVIDIDQSKQENTMTIRHNDKLWMNCHLKENKSYALAQRIKKNHE